MQQQSTGLDITTITCYTCSPLGPEGVPNKKSFNVWSFVPSFSGQQWSEKSEQNGDDHVYLWTMFGTRHQLFSSVLPGVSASAETGPPQAECFKFILVIGLLVLQVFCYKPKYLTDFMMMMLYETSKELWEKHDLHWACGHVDMFLTYSAEYLVLLD